MAAITWRNIDAPSLGDPNRTLLSAQQGMNQGFATLGDVLKGYQDNQAKNWDITKVNNTEDFYAKAAAQFRTPEEFKAALASGQLQGMASANGAQIDQAAVRQFMDTRGGVLQDRALKENTYNDSQQELRLRPLMQQAKALAVDGTKRGELQAFLAANPELMGRHGGELIAAGVVGEREAKQFGWAGDRAAEAALKAPLDRAQLTAQTNDIAAAAIDRRSNAASSATSAGAAASNAATNAAQLSFQSGEALQKRLEALEASKQGVGATISSAAGNEMLLAEIGKAPKDKQGRLFEAAGKIGADPEFAGLPAAVVAKALMGSIDNSNWFNWTDNTGDAAKAILRDAIKAPGFADEIAKSQNRLQGLNEQTAFLRQQISGLSPGGAGGAARTAAPVSGATPAPAPAPAPASPGAALVAAAESAAPAPVAAALTARTGPLTSRELFDKQGGGAREAADLKATADAKLARLAETQQKDVIAKVQRSPEIQKLLTQAAEKARSGDQRAAAELAAQAETLTNVAVLREAQKKTLK